jgi:hypothetical protein
MGTRPLRVALTPTALLVSIGCVHHIGRCPGSSAPPASPSFEETEVEPADPIEIEDAAYIDKRRIAILVHYRGGSEPHRFTLHMDQHWKQETAIPGGLLQHFAPPAGGNAIRRCWVDFDFGERWVANVEISSDRAVVFPLRLAGPGWQEAAAPWWLQ